MVRPLALPNLAFFCAIALSYIIFTVGFSTVRQSLAISAFNFAIAAYLNKRIATSAALWLLCVLFQYVSIIYIFSFGLTALTYRKFKSPLYDVMIFATLCVGALLTSAIFLLLAQSGMTLESRRITYYVSVISARGLNKWDLVFSVVLVGIAAHVLLSIFYRERSEFEIFASRMMLVLSAIAISAILIPVVRERASYQMWIMYAVVLAYQITVLRKLAIVTAFVFAAVFAALVPFRFPSRLMFEPYQNYLLAKLSLADYPPRQYDKFMSEYIALMVPSEVQHLPRVSKGHGQPAKSTQVETLPEAVAERRPCGSPKQRFSVGPTD